jgi:hypothetical protein
MRVVSDRRRPLDLATLRQPAQRKGAGSPSPGTFLDPDDPQHAELFEQIRDRMERRWCEETIPALGGLTPREAAADPTRRENLSRLLDSFEATGDPAGSVSMRPRRLRNLLGLS